MAFAHKVTENNLSPVVAYEEKVRAAQKDPFPLCVATGTSTIRFPSFSIYDPEFN